MNQFMLQASTHHILVVIRETDSLRHKCALLPNKCVGETVNYVVISYCSFILGYESDIAIGEEMS